MSECTYVAVMQGTPLICEISSNCTSCFEKLKFTLTFNFILSSLRNFDFLFVFHVYLSCLYFFVSFLLKSSNCPFSGLQIKNSSKNICNHQSIIRERVRKARVTLQHGVTLARSEILAQKSFCNIFCCLTNIRYCVLKSS